MESMVKAFSKLHDFKRGFDGATESLELDNRLLRLCVRLR